MYVRIKACNVMHCFPSWSPLVEALARLGLHIYTSTYYYTEEGERGETKEEDLLPLARLSSSVTLF
jgi:hypothetical protein